MTDQPSSGFAADIATARPPGRRGLGWRGYLLFALLCFGGGIAAVVWAMDNSEIARRWIAGSTPPDAIADAPATPATPLAAAPPISAPVPFVATPADPDKLARIEARLAEIERGTSAASDNASRAEGLLLAFAARRAIDRGLALGYIEGQLQAHFGATQPRAVGMIIAAARQPVTTAQLAADLSALGPRLETRGGNAGDWWRATRDQLSQLFVIRDAQTPSAAPADRLARAQTLIEAGRVDLALTEVARMPGASAAADWMARARAHVEAGRALDLLEAAAIMTSSSGGPSARAPAQPAPGVPRDETVF